MCVWQRVSIGNRNRLIGSSPKKFDERSWEPELRFVEMEEKEKDSKSTEERQYDRWIIAPASGSETSSTATEGWLFCF